MVVVYIILTVHPQGPYGYPILRNLGWVFAVMSKSRRMAPGLWGGSLDWVAVEELKSSSATRTRMCGRQWRFLLIYLNFPLAK